MNWVAFAHIANGAGEILTTEIVVMYTIFGLIEYGNTMGKYLVGISKLQK